MTSLFALFGLLKCLRVSAAAKVSLLVAVEQVMSSEEEDPSALTSVDHIVAGTVAFMQLVATLVSVHLWWYRRWPPYIIKNSNLVIVMVSLSPLLFTT